MNRSVYKSKKLTLAESVKAASNSSGVLLEDIVNLKKKPRDTDTAIKGAREAVIKGFNPYDILLKKHKDAVNAVYKQLKHEFKDAGTKEKKITVSANFIRNGQFVQPKDGVLLIGVHVYMPVKKGIIARLFTGSLGNLFQQVGVIGLKTYVKVFGGEEYAKQIKDANVFNANGEGENEGKVSYFVCLKIPTTEG